MRTVENRAGYEIILIADAPDALQELCGISLFERLLRDLQRLGLARALVLSATPQAIQTHLLEPAWARSEITTHVAPREKIPVTVGQIARLDLEGAERFLVVSAGGCYDRRLIQALRGQHRTAVLIDSAPPAAVLPLFNSARDGWDCQCALVEKSWLANENPNASLFPLLAEAARAGSIEAVDASEQSSYIADLRRHLRPIWFPAPAPDNRPRAETLLLDAAQSGTLDLPAKIHAPIETWIIGRLCKTRITPMQITLFTALVSASTTALFASGQLAAGTILALAVGILDGLDGKQARVKVETTELGKLEHVLDYVLELSWWAALAYHFTRGGEVPGAYGLLLLLVGADLLGRLAKMLVKSQTGRNLDDVASIDRFVRLIGGRRNVYVWMLAAGLAAGIADKAFVCLCWWAALTAAVHMLRAGWIGSRRPSLA